MQSYIPYHLLRPAPSDSSAETDGFGSTGDPGSEEGESHIPAELTAEPDERASDSGESEAPSEARARVPRMSESESDSATPQHFRTPLPRSGAATTPSRAPGSTSTRLESGADRMVGSLLSIVASISENVNRMREQQERTLAAQDESVEAHTASTAGLSLSVEEIRGRMETIMRYPLYDALSRFGDEHLELSTGYHTREPSPRPNGAGRGEGIGHPLAAQLDAQRDAIGTLTLTVEGMREHFEAQTRAFRSQADSCAALAEAAKREGRGSGTHTDALKHLAEEIDSLGTKHTNALTNHGVTLNTLRAAVDAHSASLSGLRKTVDGLRAPPHPATAVSEAVAAVHSSTAALEQLALGEIAGKNDTLASRTAAYTAERERMAGEMAALRARCTEAENAARTQIKVKDDEVRRLTLERDHAREDMFKAKEELYAATSRLCSKCSRRFEEQRTGSTGSWQFR